MSSSQQQGTASEFFARPPPRQNTTDHPLAASNVDLSRSNTGSQQQQQQPLQPGTISLLPPPPPPPLPVQTPPAVSLTATIAPTPASPSKTLEDLVEDFVSTPAPPPLPDSTPELERLCILTHRRAWEDVLKLCWNLLQGSSSHYAPLYEALLMGRNSSAVISLETHQRELVFVMHTYIQALIKLGRYHDLVLEMERWSFCHHNDRSAPAWIPWSLHIAAASALQFIPKDPSNRGDPGAQLKAYNTCLDALWAIRSDLIPQNEAVAIMHVENAIANVFIAMKEWRMVLSCYQRMIEVLPFVATDEAAKLIQSMNLSADRQVVTRTLELTYKTELLSRQGRVLLQAGAVDAASQIFAQASTIFNDTLDESSKDILSEHAAVQNLPALLSVDDGLYQFSLGQYDQAMQHFQTAVDYLRKSTPPTRVQSEIINYDTIALATMSRENLYSECINNMALAALYTCRLADALQLMESLVQENVTAHLTARVALNLCTLYELASESAASARKKRVLQMVAKRFSLHDIPAESFRVNN